MTDHDIEMKLKSSLERSAPDGLERLLSAVDNGKGDAMENTNNKSIRKRSRWIGAIAAVLAVVLLGGAGGFYYTRNVAVATVVSLDVNPSIQLEVNRSEKILTCAGLNDEGRQILASMNGGSDLKGAKLNVAVNAIVGAIVRAGYLDSLSSAILISVEDNNAARGERLQAQLVAEVDGVLQTAANSAGVLSQYLTVDAGLNQQAQQNSISAGKAALVNQVLALNPGLDFNKLAALSVEELRDLIKIGAPDMPIGRTEAASIAEEHAGTSALNIDVVREVDPELDDPVPHYEVEIYYDREYGYTVHAFTGEVLSGQAGIVDPSPSVSTNPIEPGNPSSPVQMPTIIGEGEARAAALRHAGLTETAVTFTKTELDVDDGRSVYEVEFYTDFAAIYDYEIDAATGEVVKYETMEAASPTAPAQSTPTAPTETTAPTAPAVTDIGADAAKSAALKHAGLSADQVTFVKAQKDYDDGRLVYDVEFYTDDTEYDYEIAADGTVVKYETEKRPSAPASTAPAQPADIGEAAAKSAALERAGISDASTVTWIKCQHDWDDGWQKYELEFECGATVYECDINAVSGAVTKFESEPCDNLAHHHSDSHDADDHHSSTSDVGADAAKNAALSHAGLSESQVTRLKCERDYDDGRMEYEVSFVSGGYEYEYKIDASTGSILEHERERDD